MEAIHDYLAEYGKEKSDLLFDPSSERHYIVVDYENEPGEASNIIKHFLPEELEKLL